MSALPLISVCACTYKRPQLLSDLLISLAGQQLNVFRFEIIVVDNDKDASASPVIEKFRVAQPQIALTYDVEPNQGISFARNRSVALASGEYVAFIDDDEQAAPNWLADLYSMLSTTGADAVFGPVLPMYPAGTPHWIIESRFFERPRLAAGASTDSANARTGNALIHVRWCRLRQPACFDIEIAHSGGEDHDFFRWLEASGARFVWCDTATVSELVPMERQRLSFMLERRLRSSMGYWRVVNADRSRCMAFVEAIKGCFAIIMFGICGLLLVPFGFGKLVANWSRAMGGLGRVLALSTIRLAGYGPKP